MGSEHQPLHSVGIYRNLPTFDPKIKDLTAIVTGANGISGFATMRVLLESPGRWSKVYALSRKPPPREMMALLTESQRSRVQHVAVDFLHDPATISDALTKAGVTADYIFFYSYLQPKPRADQPKTHTWSNADELARVNKALFGNFLEALEQAGIRPKRLLLQTGAKNYGVHIGRHRMPANESDPLPKHLESNFYYPQYNLLEEYCKRNGVGWSVICPAWIIGATTTAQINGLHPFAVYAAVQAHKGEKLHFASDWDIWQDECMHATARLTGYLSEWAVLEEKCKDQKL
jgi:nucleoside-diphosphate-sugar epimerase